MKTYCCDCRYAYESFLDKNSHCYNCKEHRNFVSATPSDDKKSRTDCDTALRDELKSANMENKRLRDVLEQAIGYLEKHPKYHYSCEDCWYSCPKSEDGCCDENEKDECNCGADEENAEIHAMVKKLRQALKGCEE